MVRFIKLIIIIKQFYRFCTELLDHSFKIYYNRTNGPESRATHRSQNDFLMRLSGCRFHLVMLGLLCAIAPAWSGPLPTVLVFTTDQDPTDLNTEQLVTHIQLALDDYRVESVTIEERVLDEVPVVSIRSITSARDATAGVWIETSQDDESVLRMVIPDCSDHLSRRITWTSDRDHEAEVALAVRDLLTQGLASCRSAPPTPRPSSPVTRPAPPPSPAEQLPRVDGGIFFALNGGLLDHTGPVSQYGGRIFLEVAIFKGIFVRVMLTSTISRSKRTVEQTINQTVFTDKSTVHWRTVQPGLQLGYNWRFTHWSAGPTLGLLLVGSEMRETNRQAYTAIRPSAPPLVSWRMRYALGLELRFFVLPTIAVGIHGAVGYWPFKPRSLINYDGSEVILDPPSLDWSALAGLIVYFKEEKKTGKVSRERQQ